MRYLPLSDADRQRDAARRRRRLDRRSVRRRARGRAADGKIEGLPDHACELGGGAPAGAACPAQHRRRRGALLPRLRRLPPPHPGQRRPSHPARRVPDQLHALPARDRPGHAAGPVRVPDPGRAALRLRRRQRLDVRRLDRLLGGDRHGAADHPPRQGDPLVRPSSPLRLGGADDGALHRRRARDRGAGADAATGHRRGCST